MSSPSGRSAVFLSHISQNLFLCANNEAAFMQIVVQFFERFKKNVKKYEIKFKRETMDDTGTPRRGRDRNGRNLV